MKIIHEEPIFGGDMLEDMRDSAEVQQVIDDAERIALIYDSADRVRFETWEIHKNVPMGDIQSAMAEIALDMFIRGMRAAGR